MKFYVTKADIRDGKQGDCKKCPVALAILRKLKVRYVAVGNLGSVHIGRNRTSFSLLFSLPTYVTAFINRFDSGEPVKPFSFSIPNLEKRIMQ